MTWQPIDTAPAAETDAILALAAIIREVDGNHNLGAAALAEAILSHRDSRWCHQPAPSAEGEQRHPAPVPVAERLQSLAAELNGTIYPQEQSND